MNDIDHLNAAMLNIIDGVEKLTDMVEKLDNRLKKLEEAKQPVVFPQYSPSEWPQPTRWNYPEYPTVTRWVTTCGGNRADTN